MLAILGPFPFGIKTASYNSFQRSTAERWASSPRIGKRASKQHLGPGDDTITLSGVLMPEISGGRSNLDILRALERGGLAWPFIDGEGQIYGLWVITNITEKRSEMMRNGEARKIEFTLTLERHDDTDIDLIGALTRVALGLVT